MHIQPARRLLPDAGTSLIRTRPVLRSVQQRCFPWLSLMLSAGRPQAADSCMPVIRNMNLYDSASECISQVAVRIDAVLRMPLTFGSVNLTQKSACSRRSASAAQKILSCSRELVDLIRLRRRQTAVVIVRKTCDLAELTPDKDVLLLA